MPHVARDLFEQFRARDMARIDECIAVGEEEGPAINFMENRTNRESATRVGALDEHGRRVFEKARSAMLSILLRSGLHISGAS